jgi:NADH:ubiquinone oxidoreductase subunit E
MAFFKIKSTCPSDFLKNITLRYYEFCSKLYVHTVCLILEVSLCNFSHLQDQYVTHYKKIEKSMELRHNNGTCLSFSCGANGSSDVMAL